MGGIVEDGQGIDLFLGVEGVDQSTAEMPHQKQGGTAAQHDAAEAQKGTDPASEAVSRRDLHHLAGDEGDDHLYCRNEHQGQSTQDVMLADGLPHRGGVSQVFPQKPDSQNRQDQEKGRDDAEDEGGSGTLHRRIRGRI